MSCNITTCSVNCDSQIEFADVLAEPDAAHSNSCLWKTSYVWEIERVSNEPSTRYHLKSPKSVLVVSHVTHIFTLFQMLHWEQDLYVQTVCATMWMLHGPGVGMCIWSIGLSGNLRLHPVRVHVWFLDLLRQRHLWSLFSVPCWTYSWNIWFIIHKHQRNEACARQYCSKKITT